MLSGDTLGPRIRGVPGVKVVGEERAALQALADKDRSIKIEQKSLLSMAKS